MPISSHFAVQGTAKINWCYSRVQRQVFASSLEWSGVPADAFLPCANPSRFGTMDHDGCELGPSRIMAGTQNRLLERHHLRQPVLRRVGECRGE